VSFGWRKTSNFTLVTHTDEEKPAVGVCEGGQKLRDDPVRREMELELDVLRFASVNELFESFIWDWML
jgi:hypothetical protein